MPQLFSRMDDLNWLTPSIADILDQGTVSLGGSGSVREQMLTLQNELAALETPAKVINISAQPSHTAFVLQPDYVGRLASRRLVTQAEIRRSVGQIAEHHKEWRIGFLPTVDESPQHCAILLRTAEHRPLSLRRLIVQSAFKNETSNLALVLGSGLNQQVVVRALDTIENLLVVGEGAGVSHLLSAALLTLVTFNTPSEVKIALGGARSEPYAVLANTPHSLGRAIKDPDGLTRLVNGVASELQRRLNVFYDEGVNLLSAYNAHLREQQKAPLPRIVLALNSLSDESFMPLHEVLAAPLRDLVLNGAQVGIHLILTVDHNDHLPPQLIGVIQNEVVLRSSQPELAEKVKNFHPSLLRFVDAFVVDHREEAVIPVELCAVQPEELQRTAEYWKQAEAIRVAQLQDTSVVDVAPLPPPPMMPDSVTIGKEALPHPEVTASERLSQQATALASYLGWVSIGALQDVLLVSQLEASALLAELQDNGIVEAGSGRIHRYIRPMPPQESAS